MVPIKVILDIYEHYYIKYDYPTYEVSFRLKIKNLCNSYIPTAILFYTSLSDESIKLIYEKLKSESFISIRFS